MIVVSRLLLQAWISSWSCLSLSSKVASLCMMRHTNCSKVWASFGVLWQVVGFTICRGGEWEAIDLKDVVVHIFTAEQRERYSLDEYYAQAEVCCSICLLTSFNLRLNTIPDDGRSRKSMRPLPCILSPLNMVQNAWGCCYSAIKFLN